jgi:hypothetical protein
MRGRKTFAILVMAVLLFTTFAVSSVFCDEELSDDSSRIFLPEEGSGNDAGTCGGGGGGGDGGPQFN